MNKIIKYKVQNVLNEGFQNVHKLTHTHIVSIPAFNFYLNNNPPFDFDATAVYTVTVGCTDSNSETGTGDITVNLTPNPSPDIPSLPTGVSVSETAAIGFKVYDVTVTDTDPFTCVIDAQGPTAATFSISNPTSKY